MCNARKYAKARFTFDTAKHSPIITYLFSKATKTIALFNLGKYGILDEIFSSGQNYFERGLHFFTLLFMTGTAKDNSVRDSSLVQCVESGQEVVGLVKFAELIFEIEKT